MNDRHTGCGITIEDFEAGNVVADMFDHEAHIRVARLFLLRFGQTDGSERFLRALRRLTHQIGVPDKYHETISRFYLTVIAERLRHAQDQNWAAFRSRNADLFDGSLLKAAYSEKRLWSAEARAHFLLPDRAVAA